MREYGELWPGLCEDATNVARCGVVRENRLHERRTDQIRISHGDLMNEHVDIDPVLDEVFIIFGITGDEHRAPSEVDPIAIGWFDGYTVVNFERCDLHAVLFKNDAIFIEFGRVHLDRVTRDGLIP